MTQRKGQGVTVAYAEPTVPRAFSRLPDGNSSADPPPPVLRSARCMVDEEAGFAPNCLSEIKK